MTDADASVVRYRKEIWRLLAQVDAELVLVVSGKTCVRWRGSMA